MSVLKDKKIFAIEDSQEARVLLRMMLVRHDARVEFDLWGRDTVQRMKAFAPIDLVLLDLMLPGGNSGFQVLQNIRQDSAFDDVPVVAFSAADPAVMLPRCQAYGFSGYIAKPVDMKLFPHQLAQVMNGEPVWYAERIYAR